MSIDMVNKPPHYNNHPSGIEVYEITKHLNFALGSAFKYIARFDKKGKPVEDLQKAVWYVNSAIKDKSEFPNHKAVCGDRYVLGGLLGNYMYSEPNSAVDGLIAIFMSAVVEIDTSAEVGVDILHHLVFGLEHFIAAQIPD